ncbi:MAG TPA: hypothetical protein VF092_17150 [Longimicrobium sp.]
MPVFLQTLLGLAPDNVALTPCPPPPPGDPIDPGGFYDPSSVSSAYMAAGLATVGLVLLLVVLVYLWNSTALGPRFVRRWWWTGIAAVLLAGLLGGLVIGLWPTHALAGSCETNPTAFARHLPFRLALNRGVAGLLWGLVLYPVVSLILTRSVGYLPAARNGFFHNRGCPVPRWR